MQAIPTTSMFVAEGGILWFEEAVTLAVVLVLSLLGCVLNRKKIEGTFFKTFYNIMLLLPLIIVLIRVCIGGMDIIERTNAANPDVFATVNSLFNVGFFVLVAITMILPLIAFVRKYIEYTQFYDLLRDIIGYNYSYGQTYYFAAQAIAKEGMAYESSDISAIGTNGFARDASKGTEKYTVTVENGTIDGEHTTVEAGYGVVLTLTMNSETAGIFKGWYLVDAEGNEIGDALSTANEYVYTVTENATVKAVFVEEKTKLATPDNSESKLLYLKSTGDFIEIDRAGTTMFVAGTDHILFYIYETADANVKDYVGQFKLYPSPEDTYLSTTIATVDDTTSLKIVCGANGNLWIRKSEFAQFYDS